MKKITIAAVLVIVFLSVRAQEKHAAKSEGQSTTGAYGNTLNISVGTGYGYGYNYGNSVFPLLLNYELDVAKNFTLAPFIGFYSYRYYYYYWAPGYYYYQNNYYRSTVVPIGVKGFYYFDDLLQANEKWDFYMALSLGFAYRHTTWENGYNGPAPRNTTSSAYLELHAGAEYHLNEKAGLFFDLSTGVSSIGISIKTR